MEEVARLQLWAGEQVVDRLDQGEGHVQRFRLFEPLLRRLRSKRWHEELEELVPVLHAPLGGLEALLGEPRFIEELGDAVHPHGGDSARRAVHIAITRRDHPQSRLDALLASPDLAVVRVGDEALAEGVRDHRLVRRDVNAQRAGPDRSAQRREGGRSPGCSAHEFRLVRGQLLRWLIRFPGQEQQAAGGLDREFGRGPRALRPGEPEGGDADD